MTALTVAIIKGSGSLRHNDRTLEPKNSSAAKTWDPEKTQHNIVFKNQDLKEAYREIFSESVKQYNAEQDAKGRKYKQYKIKSYYDKIYRSGKEKLFYENIVSVGNVNDVPKGSDLEQTCKDVLTEYMQGFETRNPNFYVVQAIIHNDEIGVPHLHIDYVPVAKRTKTGLPLKNSFSGALREMGFKGADNFIKWREREEAAVIVTMSHYGLESKPGDGRKIHYSIPEYKQIAEEKERIKDEKKKVFSNEARLKAENEKLSQKAEQLAAREQKILDMKSQMIQEVDQLSKQGAFAAKIIEKSQLLEEAEAAHMQIRKENQNKKSKLLEEAKLQSFDQYIERARLTGKETGYLRIPADVFYKDRNQLLKFAEKQLALTVKHTQQLSAVLKAFKEGQFNSTDPGLLNWKRDLALKDIELQEKEQNIDFTVYTKVLNAELNQLMREQDLQQKEQKIAPMLADASNRLLEAENIERNISEIKEKLADYNDKTLRLDQAEKALKEAEKTITIQEAAIRDKDDYINFLDRDVEKKYDEVDALTDEILENEKIIADLSHELELIRPKAQKSENTERDLSAEKEKSERLAAELKHIQAQYQQQIQQNMQLSAALSQAKREEEELKEWLKQEQEALFKERNKSSELRMLFVEVGVRVLKMDPEVYSTISPVMPEYIKAGVKIDKYSKNLWNQVSLLHKDNQLLDAIDAQQEVLNEQWQMISKGQMPESDAEIRRRFGIYAPKIEKVLEDREKPRQQMPEQTRLRYTQKDNDYEMEF